MFARLAAAPFGLSPARARKLTRRQLAHLYFRRRDEWGNLREEEDAAAAAAADPEAPLRQVCRDWGWPAWLAEQWVARRAAEDGTAAAAR